MRETFKIKGVDITVEYNNNLYTSKDVEKMLKHAAKDYEEFSEIQSEIEIIDEMEVTKQLFPKEYEKLPIKTQEEYDFIISHLNYVNKK